MSLTNSSQKMSKSDRSQKGIIYLTDEPLIIEKKIMRATTDSQGKVKHSFTQITYAPEKRPELANLLHIYAALEEMSVREAVESLQDDNMHSFKLKLKDKIIDE